MSSSTISGQPGKTAVNTAKVTGRRVLHFTALDDIRADAERLAAGGARQLGNWSLGQATVHLARTMKMAIDGDPICARFPMRLIARLMKRTMLTKGMRPGFKLPKAAEEKYVAAPYVSTDQGLNELRSAIERLKAESQRHPHPAFGPMTHQEWEQLHLRHAELHLSFFVPQ